MHFYIVRQTQLSSVKIWFTFNKAPQYFPPKNNSIKGSLSVLSNVLCLDDSQTINSRSETIVKQHGDISVVFNFSFFFLPEIKGEA